MVEVVSDPRRRLDAFIIKVLTVLPTNVEPVIIDTTTVEADKLEAVKLEA